MAFRKRELFAYSCEAHGKHLELAGRLAARKAHLAEYAHYHIPSAFGEDRVGHLEIPEAAVGGRSGWKVLRERGREPRA